MAIGAFLVGFVFSNSGFKSFLSGFIAIGLLWLGLALYVDNATHSILTEKISQLFPLNLFVLTTLIGGLVGGFASMTGALLKP
jgi:cell division protein FtsX